MEVMEDDLGRGAEGRSRSREAGGRRGQVREAGAPHAWDSLLGTQGLEFSVA